MKRRDWRANLCRAHNSRARNKWASWSRPNSQPSRSTTSFARKNCELGRFSTQNPPRRRIETFYRLKHFVQHFGATTVASSHVVEQSCRVLALAPDRPNKRQPVLLEISF